LRVYQLVRRISEESNVAGFESKEMEHVFFCVSGQLWWFKKFFTKTLELNIKQVMNKAIPISGASQPP